MLNIGRHVYPGVHSLLVHRYGWTWKSRVRKCPNWYGDALHVVALYRVVVEARSQTPPTPSPLTTIGPHPFAAGISSRRWSVSLDAHASGQMCFKRDRSAVLRTGRGPPAALRRAGVVPACRFDAVAPRCKQRWPGSHTRVAHRCDDGHRRAAGSLNSPLLRAGEPSPGQRSASSAVRGSRTSGASRTSVRSAPGLRVVLVARMETFALTQSCSYCAARVRSWPTLRLCRCPLRLDVEERSGTHTRQQTVSAKNRPTADISGSQHAKARHEDGLLGVSSY